MEVTLFLQEPKMIKNPIKKYFENFPISVVIKIKLFCHCKIAQNMGRQFAENGVFELLTLSNYAGFSSSDFMLRIICEGRSVLFSLG